MIKIFSINEILEATNDLLKKPKEEKTKYKVSEEPLILKENFSKEKKENSKISEVPKSTEQLIHEAEKGSQDFKKKKSEKTNKTISDKKNNINNLSINEKRDLISEKKNNKRNSSPLQK